MWWRFGFTIGFVLCLVFIPFIMDFFMNLRSPYDSVDPKNMRAKLLKLILDERGISHEALLEKSELAKLVNHSGSVSPGSLKYTIASENSDVLEDVNFWKSESFEAVYHELAEKSRGQMWVFQIKPYNSNYYLIDLEKWSKIANFFKRFRVNFGLIDCNHIPGFCASKDWHRHQIFIIIPKSASLNDLVVMTSIRPPRIEAVSEWLKNSINQKVLRLTSFEDLRNWVSCRNMYCSNPKMILIADLEEPPLFYSILSVKFAGYVKFAFYSLDKSLASVKVSNWLDSSFSGTAPYYLFTINNTTTRYGSRWGHHFSSNALGVYIGSVVLNMDDVFIVTLLLVNVLVAVKFYLIIDTGFWHHCIKSIGQLAVWNFFLFVFWLIVLTLTQFSVVDVTFSYFLVCYQKVATSFLGDLARHCFLFWQHHPIDLSLFLFFYSSLALMVLRWDVTPQSPIDAGTSQYSAISNYLFQPVPTPDYPLLDVGLESGMEFLIERLAMPNLWLPSSLSQSFIHRLPTWVFCGQHQTESDVSGTETESEEADTSRWLFRPLHSMFHGGTHSETKCDSKIVCQCPAKILSCRQCAICLESYKRAAVLCMLPCDHFFHLKCITLWFDSSTLCPICRWPAEKIK